MKFLKEMIQRIALTYLCNLDCDYCYTKSFNKYPKFIKIEHFKKIISKLKPKRIFLLGGEPTIHPQFNDILNILYHYKKKATLATNCLFDSSKFNEKFSKVIDVCTINPQVILSNNKRRLKKFNRNIIFLKNNVKEICLVYTYLNGSFNRKIFNFCDKHNIKKITFSPALPDKDIGNSYFSLKKDMGIGKKIFNFVRFSNSKGISVFLISALPFCIFTSQQRKYLIKYAGLHFTCSCGVGVIHPFLSISPCPFLYFSGPKYNKFNNIKEVKKYFKKTIDKLKWEKTLFNDCKECLLFFKKVCQGACLNYKTKL